MNRLLSLFLLLSLPVFAKDDTKEKVCVFLKKTNEYNSYIKRMEKVFISSLDDSLFDQEVFYHKSSIESIKQVAQKISTDRCKFIWGGISSSDSLKLLKLLQMPNKTLITPTSSSIELSKLQKNTVYMTPNDNEVADLIFSKIKREEKEVIVIQNVSFPNTNVIGAKLFELFKKNGNKVKRIKIFKHTKNILFPEIKGEQIVVVPSYESDLNKVVKSLGNVKGITFVGIDAWGTNESVYKKFASGSKNFNSIRLGYWNNRTCERKEFQSICKKHSKYFSKEFDSFMAIAFDSAVYLNQLEGSSKDSFMAYQPSSIFRNGHFYSISSNGIQYMETK